MTPFEAKLVLTLFPTILLSLRGAWMALDEEHVGIRDVVAWLIATLMLFCLFYSLTCLWQAAGVVWRAG